MGQDKYAYYIVAKPQYSLEPTSHLKPTDSTKVLNFANQHIETFFNGKTVYKHTKAFPTAKTPYLQRVYWTVLDNGTYLDDILNLNEIEHAEFLGKLELPVPLYEPNDYHKQFPGRYSYLELINAKRAWDITHGLSSVYAGVLDSQFELTHDDIQNKIVHNFDNSSSSNHHGTRVSGLVAAETNNNVGIASIGFNTKLVTYEYHSGSFANQALLLSQYSGVKVINISLLGSCTFSAINDDVYKEIYESGVVVVCAAGNGYLGNSCNSANGQNEYVYPASYDWNISVSSVGHIYPIGTDHPQYGKLNWQDVHESIIGDPLATHTHNDKVDISAPGYNIYTTTENNSYITGTGTSYASPQVAGIVALMFAVNPDITPVEVKTVLQDTAVDIYDIPENSPYIGLLGAGRVNAYGAVIGAQCLDENNPEVDLVIWDSDEDKGDEPNTNTVQMWESPEIWVRNLPDKSTKHQNPEYDPDNPPNVYVRITNKGCATSSGNDQLKLYWAKAGTNLTWPNSWVDAKVGTLPMGDLLATVTIPSLKPGEEITLEVPWNNMPDPNLYQTINPGFWHFCLLARIESTDDPIDNVTSVMGTYVLSNNNIAWKNLTVIDDFQKRSGVIAVSNPFETPKRFNLEFKSNENEPGKPIYEEAEVSIKMDARLYQAWEEGGGQMYNLANTEEEKTKIVTGDNARLNNILFGEGQLGTLNLNFNFLTEEITDKTTFAYSVIETNAQTQAIIGGETYIINKTRDRELFLADGGSDKSIKKNDNITLSANTLNEPATYKWYDPEGNLIYVGTNLTVSPEITKKYKLEIIADADGYKDYDEVEIEVKLYSLSNLIPNPASNQVSIHYNAQGANSAYLMITNSVSAVSNNYILDTSQSQETIDLSNYVSGIYVVSLVCDGNIVATGNLAIN